MTSTPWAEIGRSSPTARAEAARMRADELRQRRAELACGVPVTAQNAETARLRAHQSLARAESANRAAAARHNDAGQACRRAAAAHEQAAMLARGVIEEAHQDAAEKLRAAAASHEAAAKAAPHTWRAPGRH